MTWNIFFMFIVLLDFGLAWSPDMPGGLKIKTDGRLLSFTTQMCSGGVFFKKPVKIQTMCMHGYFFKRPNACNMAGSSIIAGTNYACTKIEGMVQAFIPLTNPFSPLDHTLTFFDDGKTLRNLRRFTYVSALEQKYDIANSNATGVVVVNTRKTPGINFGNLCYEGKRDTSGTSFWATLNVSFLEDDGNNFFTRRCAPNSMGFPWSQAQRYSLKVGYSKRKDFEYEIPAILPRQKYYGNSHKTNLPNFEIWDGMAYCLQEEQLEMRNGRVRMIGIYPRIESLQHFCTKPAHKRTLRSINQAAHHQSSNDFQALPRHQKKLRPAKHTQNKSPEEFNPPEESHCPPFCLNVFYDGTNSTKLDSAENKGEPSVGGTTNDLENSRETKLNDVIPSESKTTNNMGTKDSWPQRNTVNPESASNNGFTQSKERQSDNVKHMNFSIAIDKCADVCRNSPHLFFPPAPRFYRASGRRSLEIFPNATHYNNGREIDFNPQMPQLVRVPRHYSEQSSVRMSGQRIYRPLTHNPQRFIVPRFYRETDQPNFFPRRSYRASIQSPRVQYRGPMERVPMERWLPPQPIYKPAPVPLPNPERYPRQSQVRIDEPYRRSDSNLEEPNPNLEESIFSADNIKITIINRQGGGFDEDMGSGKYRTFAPSNEARRYQERNFQGNTVDVRGTCPPNCDP